MNLVIDIGNSLTKLACYSEDQLVDSIRTSSLHSADSVLFLNRYPFQAVILSSVAGRPEEDFMPAGRKEIPIIHLNHLTPMPITLRYESRETLGYDRIAAAAGAWAIHPDQPVMVIDMGTAVTIDVLEAGGIFAGGNISPGMHLRYRALSEFTAALPYEKQTYPFSHTGTDTRSAIVAGVQLGIVYELNGYMQSFLNSNRKGRVMLTGGDAPFFLPLLSHGAVLVPNLVSDGLNTILNYNLQQVS